MWKMSSRREVSCDFFFQAEDGIRDLTVTGVQTCALPISTRKNRPSRAMAYGTREPVSTEELSVVNAERTIAAVIHAAARAPAKTRTVSEATFWAVATASMGRTRKYTAFASR